MGDSSEEAEVVVCVEVEGVDDDAVGDVGVAIGLLEGQKVW